MGKKDLAQKYAEAFAKSARAPPEDQGPLLLRILWILLGISILVVILRLWTKFRTAHRIYVDDLFMAAALVVGIFHAVLITIAVSSGFGQHIVHLKVPEIEHTIKFGAISLSLGWLAPMLARISFCCTMLYLTKTDPRVKDWPVYVFIALQVVVNVVGIIVFNVQCGTHLDVMWHMSQWFHFADYCWNPNIQTNYQYFMGSLNTITDMFLAITPAILIEHTKLSRRCKVTLWFLLCLSVLAMVAAVIKTYEAKILHEVTDYTYNLCFYVIWVSLELNIVIITASIPLLRPLFQECWRQIQIYRKASSSANTSLRSAPTRWGRSRSHSHIHLGSAVSSDERDISKVEMRAVQTSLTSSIDAVLAEQQRAEEDKRDRAVREAGGMGTSVSVDGITVTRDFEVTFEHCDAPFVHAALVGLIQGEMLNPRLVQRFE